MKSRASRSLNLLVYFLLCAFFLGSLHSVYAAAQPEGPDVTITSTNTRSSPIPANLSAIAGNITELVVSGISVTQTWMGYVGNVSGTITLDDALNNTLYNWSLPSPSGEVYATYLTSVDWTAGRVYCWNWTAVTNGDAASLVIEEFEGRDGAPGVDVPLSIFTYLGNLSIPLGARDNFSQTFSEYGASSHSNFFIGSQYINGSTPVSCPRVQLYNSTGQNKFEEVLLYHNASNFNNSGVVYASILQSDIVGYDGNPWDFEMIVAENGRLGNTAATPFYFYVELE